MSFLEIALIQLASKPNDIGYSFRKLAEYLNTLRGKVDLVVLPEMWLSGFEIENVKAHAEQTSSALDFLKKWARKKRCHLIGSQLEAHQNRYYNTALWIGPSGEELARYRKIHLFQPLGEHKKFAAGNKIEVFEADFGKVGLAICYDLRFPEMLRKMALMGAKLFVIPAAWPKERLDHYHALLKARAIENLCFVVSVNKVGKRPNSKIQYGGGSTVFDPWGRRVGKMNSQEGVLRVGIDLKAVDEIRASFPVFESRREKLYK